MATAVDISPKQDGGVLKEIIQEGTGNSFPPPGSKVSVHYTGTLLDGTKFDSSRDRGEPFQFDLGQGSVIKAWDIGVATMKVGERAVLTCAPKYAYGERGSPPTIPPNSTLKFDVEVLDWKGEDLSPKSDGGIERVEILTTGEGSSTPNDGAQVEVHLLGKFNGTVFEDRDVSFALGEGSEFKIIPGVETAIEKLKKGEKSLIRIKPQYAFGNEGSKEYNIPSNATVDYIVTLKSFEKAKELWSLDTEEKIQHAKMFKEKGTNYFKAGKYGMALKFYKKIQDYLDAEEMEGDVGKEVKSLKLASYLNAALCSLKLNDTLEARHAATKALEIDPNNEKAYFRRGQALLALEEAQAAANDFAECIRIDPSNSAAKSQQAICAKKIKEQLQKEKKLYANMFDRFAKMDAQREEIEKERQPNVLSSVGEWGKEDREREPSEFEKENPNILLLNSTGEFKDM